MDKKITRKEAIKKVGATALAATSLVFLETKASACDSVATKSQEISDSGDGGRWRWRRRRRRR